MDKRSLKQKRNARPDLAVLLRTQTAKREKGDLTPVGTAAREQNIDGREKRRTKRNLEVSRTAKNRVP